MSFELKFLKDRVVATFTNKVQENEIKNAFIEIVDSINIREINYLIFNLSVVNSLTIPKNFIRSIKTIILFSSTWNPKVKVCFITSNPNLKRAVNKIIRHQKKLIWEFNLFEKCAISCNWCEKSLSQNIN